jgi:amino acid adenylation domain-containing protein
MTARPELSPAKRRLLEQLLAGQRRASGRVADRIAPRPPGTIAPLSAEQQDVWLHAAMAPDVPLYNEAFTIHRRGSFDPELFERSLNEVVRRFELWRSSFDMRDGKLSQIVHPALHVKVHTADLTALPAGDREAAALRIAQEEARKPIDPARPPLLRAMAMRLAEDAHRVYVAIHHLIFDGVSIYRVVIPELVEIYQALCRGEPPQLPPPELQFGDYAVWREHQLANESMSRELAYWRQTLAGELPVLRLPASRVRPASPGYRGGMETFALADGVGAALKALSRREGVTLYATLLAAFKVLLHRYSGQDDIVIGGVTDMRRRPELERVVGYFLNSMPLRTRPSGDLPFRTYLAQVSDAVIGALDASTVPFNRIVREVMPRRASGRHALFDILFSIQPPAPSLPEGWDLTQMDVAVGAAKFDLYLELEERIDGGIVGRFLYSTDLFDAPAIRRMIGHWTTLLAGVSQDADCPLGALPLLTPDEVQSLLGGGSAAAPDAPATTVHDLIAAQAQRTPDATAVECEGRGWTYAELDLHAAGLAARLRRAGAGRGALVAVAVDRSLEMVAALVGVLKAGAAYLPLDPHLPEARLAQLIEDARPAVVLTERRLAARLPAGEASVIALDEIAPDQDVPAADGPPAEPDDLAYVIYTSGSTGKPKGVEIRHRSVANLLAAVEHELRLAGGEALLAVTTISFDIAALELFLPLVTGGRAIVATRDEATDPVRLAALFRRSRPAIMQATPATWRGLLAAGWTGDPALTILCGGEALPADLAARLLNCGGRLCNMYGPTETTIWSLMHDVRPGDAGPVPIGRPLANNSVYVLDTNGNPVPAGVPGELYIGGAGLARGYRGDPAQTGQRFRSVPAARGERLYRTGDLVRYRPDGLLEFMGRTDNQVKIRGFRVGLEEVDAALAGHPDVAAAAARAVPDASGEMALVAYVVSKTEPGRAIPDLPQVLKRTLPSYMVPSRIIALPALPMTPNGKVDRKRLPDVPVLAAAKAGGEPRDELERSLVGVWKDLLRLPELGVHDNFFELGGHSLLAFLLAAEIKRLTGRDLPLATLFEAPTVAALAELLRSGAEPEFSYLVQLKPGSAARPLFIVHGVFGNIVEMKGLATRLRTERPVYALQARGADPRQEPHTTIAEMADAYITALRGRQPEGPYAIGGYSFGGLVAYEMACRLRDCGQEVELLALIDVDMHERNLPMLDRLAYEWSLIERALRKAATLPPRETAAYLLRKVRQLWNRVLLRIGIREQGDPSNEITGALSPRAVRMYQIGYREFVRFRPRPFDRKIAAFRVTGPRFDACDSLPILRRLAPAVDVYGIAGAHETVMEEASVGSLAVQMNRCLAALDGGGDTALSTSRGRAGRMPHDDVIGLEPGEWAQQGN